MSAHSLVSRSKRKCSRPARLGVDPTINLSTSQIINVRSDVPEGKPTPSQKIMDDIDIASLRMLTTLRKIDVNVPLVVISDVASDEPDKQCYTNTIVFMPFCK